MRIGAILAFVGVVTYGISWAIHPSREDPGDWTRVIQEYAESANWIEIHLVQFFGLFLLMLSIMILAESLRREYRDTAVEALAFLALVTTIISAAVYAILQGIDGISLKAMVDYWAEAPANEKATAFRVSESVRWIEVGINSIFRFLQAISAVLIGAAVALTFNKSNSFRWARILGAVVIAFGIAMAVRGYAVAYSGFSTLNPLYSGTSLFVILFLLWMVIVGIVMWGRKRVSIPA